jgi:hypothetical protein
MVAVNGETGLNASSSPSQLALRHNADQRFCNVVEDNLGKRQQGDENEKDRAENFEQAAAQFDEVRKQSALRQLFVLVLGHCAFVSAVSSEAVAGAGTSFSSSCSGE